MNERFLSNSNRAAGVGRNERGEGTRQRLVQAAIDVFGRLGYEGASTRALAEAAGVNLAAIPYHFGGKEGLYLAAAAHIVEGMSQRIGPVAERVAGEFAAIDERGPAGRAACLRLLQELLVGFAEALLDREPGRWVRFIVREQIHPTRAFEILYDGVMKKVLGLVTALVARLSASHEDDETTRLKALTLLGQILTFRIARAAVLRHMRWDDIGGREIEAIQAIVRENVAAIMDADREAGRA